MSKGPQFSIAPSRASNFLIMSSKWWPLISHHVIKGSPFIIASSRGLPIVTSNFPSRYQGVPFSIASSRGPPLPPSRHQRDPNFQNFGEAGTVSVLPRRYAPMGPGSIPSPGAVCAFGFQSILASAGFLRVLLFSLLHIKLDFLNKSVSKHFMEASLRF